MAVDDGSTRTRRAVLGGGLGAVAALVAGAFGRAVPVDAANGDVMKVGSQHVSTSSTGISMGNDSVASSALQGINSGPGTGVHGRSGSGPGVQGVSVAGPGMVASSDFGYGIRASSGQNYAVWGHSPITYGVYGTSSTSYAVVGLSDSSIGVVGLSDSGGGVFGQSGGSAPGVEGRSANGRGGLFGGKAAQVRLAPSSATTHPPSGLAGDIFLDKSKRLWLCKGGTTWVRLDL